MLSEEHGLGHYSIYKDFESFGTRISSTYLVPPISVLLISELQNQKHFKSLLDGEFHVTKHQAIHVLDANHHSAVKIAQKRSKSGDPFDVVVFDMGLRFARYEACVARLRGLVKRIVPVDTTWTYARVVAAVRGDGDHAVEWPRAASLEVKGTTLE